MQDAVSRTRQFIRKYRVPVALAALLAFHAVNNYAWLRLDRQPLRDDLGKHLAAPLALVDRGNNIFETLFQGVTYIVGHFYPPLFHTVMAVFGDAFGRSLVWLVMANMPFLLLLILSLYYLGRKIASPGAGVTAAYLCTLYPYVFHLSRRPFPDFALLAMVTLGMAALVATDHFARRRQSMFLGFAAGLGMLTKQTYLLFMACPVVLSLAAGWFSADRKQRAINVVWALAIALGVCGYWYVMYFPVIWPRYVAAGFREHARICSPDIFSRGSLTYYFNVLYRAQVFVCFFVLFAAGAILWLRNRARRDLQALFIGGLLGTYALFVLIFTKEQRTTAPWLGTVALITAAGLWSIPMRWLRGTIAAAAVAFGVLQYYDLSYRDGLAGFHIARAVPFVAWRYDGAADRLRGRFEPIETDFKFRKIFAYLARESRSMRIPRVTVELLLNTDAGSYERRYSNLVSNLAAFTAAAALRKAPVECRELAPAGESYSDFVIISDRPVRGFNQAGYRIGSSFLMADKSVVYVYKRITS